MIEQVGLANYPTYFGSIVRCLKPGGIFLSDDIQDNMAFADFVRQKDASFGVVEGGGKYIGLAMKPGLRN